MGDFDSAIEQNRGAEEAMKEIENILKCRLNIKDVWKVLKDKSRFPKPRPQPPQLLPKPQPSLSISKPRPPQLLPNPQPPQLLVVPEPPKETDKKYEWYGNTDIRNSKMRLFKYDYNEWLKQKEEILKKNAELEKQYQDKLKQWELKNTELEEQYQSELKQWEAKNAELEKQYQNELKQWELKNAEIEEQYQNELKRWETEEEEFLKRQQEKNNAIDITDAVWKALKDTAEFPKPKPQLPRIPQPLPPQQLVVPPQKGQDYYYLAQEEFLELAGKTRKLLEENFLEWVKCWDGFEELLLKKTGKTDLSSVCKELFIKGGVSQPQKIYLEPYYHREEGGGELQQIWETYWPKIVEEIKERLIKDDHDKWTKEKEEILKKNPELEKEYRDELKQWEIKNTELEKQYQNELKRWETEEQEFLSKQKEINIDIDKKKEQYLGKLPDAIVDYCDLVLSKSEYPDYFPKEFDIDYNPETKILIVDYSLPSVDSIPKLKEVKYVKSRDECVEVFHAESFINMLYDSLVYQITLRTIHELYEFDTINALDSIVFNGWVKSIDKATGHEVNACILSLQANRQEFLSVNLANVDPKSCFRHLKGVGSSKLHSLTPVAPILSISREDKRFISSYAVADELDESINLAAMDWEDFEHLIRELFEKEFAQYGGEVKVTQASRDGGVDAIAFDPDPIRGGKIVIQAKRYTNTVGVSAVRDLYGTVINEGATKGILITTADYGPDAYEFAKGKPLTLFSGSHLLHLLEKHGHRAKIDLKAAREILSEREKR